MCRSAISTFFKLGIILFFGFFLCVLPTIIFGQCVNPIQSFPYNEGFETSDGQWFSGGTANDWAWGQPQKPVINKAASGIKCWITGGLTNSSYNDNENSWLQSPCFDFSSLIHPEISFKVFWDTENKFDGVTLQYSTDGGTNWKVLGSNSYNPCVSKNWYNTPAVTYLPGKVSGWSGTVQSSSGRCSGGNGSGEWLTALHDISFLAGEKKVVFRFFFGSGSECSNYDGFAIDDIKIGEATPLPADFSYNCASNNTVNFSDISECADGHSWDFGDPASGANNIVNGPKNTSHTFSAPGEYTVTLTAGFPNGSTNTVSKKIYVIQANISVIQSIRCNGDSNGIIMANVSGGNGNYQYTWNTVPVRNTAAIDHLKEGVYNVSITSLNACNTAASVTLTAPSAINIQYTKTDTECGFDNGTISTTVSGGTSPYQYLWSTGGGAKGLVSLAPGKYSLELTDANQCKSYLNDIEVKANPSSLSVSLGNDTIVCPSIILSPGIFKSYLWQDGSTSPKLEVQSGGKYFVTVTDNKGCIASDTISVTVDCNDIFFPTAFTPNNDGLNDFFGAVGSLALIQSYELKVFNRWGEIIFYSSNPQIKWSGKIKGTFAPNGTYTWTSQYTLKGRLPQSKHGSIILIR